MRPFLRCQELGSKKGWVVCQNCPCLCSLRQVPWGGGHAILTQWWQGSGVHARAVSGPLRSTAVLSLGRSWNREALGWGACFLVVLLALNVDSALAYAAQ